MKKLYLILFLILSISVVIYAEEVWLTERVVDKTWHHRKSFAIRSAERLCLSVLEGYCKQRFKGKLVDKSAKVLKCIRSRETRLYRCSAECEAGCDGSEY